ncbi:ATP-binding cassette domain-containing protein [Pseudochrobactrum sp. Wa41.01b-1]|uniref:thiamine ABC transporter ATP-binding protein n=1 Tax=Pseudochrobactrum sp. Wa41.01b-1 TaxID=2864102 RepID=UPI001C68EDD7|nr:ATP-binding cassette domain-containing protein [Pseudochrobactrum sp. Wa41.01b-1]QYM74302.1 ATP-binding cassette domain-containing protein [Pseudochrobactrum sp. Wa41.01b-1]
MTRHNAAITLDNVRFSYGATDMLFNLHLKAGETGVIVGPSGSGKSTLLNLVAGFEAPLSGRILIGDEEISSEAPAGRPVTMVFQENNLFAHLDVRANVSLGRSPSLKLNEADHLAVQNAIDRVELTGKENRKPEALSGGERQRVAIARALVRDKPVLLLDEAFASLGPALRQQMLDLIRELQQETGITILMVTHTPEDALRFDSTLFFLKDGQIREQGDAAMMLSPSGPQPVRDYMGTSEHKTS